MRAKYYWHNMKRDTARWVRSCLVCAKRKSTRRLRERESATICDITCPWDTLSIDLVEAGTTSAEKYKYILTVIDLFTRYVIAIPLKSKRASEVAEALFTHVFGVHGRPRTIRSDGGKEFVNAGLQRLYKHWNIQPITTGGYRPWCNPVERYHRFLNAGMTILSAKFGEDWTSYLQAIVFSYNASTCRSTGHTPYYLMHAREPLLLEDVALHHVHHPDNDDIVNASKRLQKAYHHVAHQQKRVADLNKKRHDQRKLTTIEYDVDDFVLHWEPAQAKTLKQHHAIIAEDNALAPRPAPRKWRNRWTGPHRIVTKTKGKTGFAYSIVHNTRNKVIDNIKQDKLHPYQPWDDGIASTSPNLDDHIKSFKIASWCEKEEMFIIPLKQPEPFGVCKAIQVLDNCRVEYQWYASQSNQPDQPFYPMWQNPKTKNTYMCKTRRHTDDLPYTCTQTGTPVKQKDILYCGFDLTKENKLPLDLIAACADNIAIWWKPRTDNRKRIKLNMRSRSTQALKK
jgi:transposase-like protein